MKLDYIPDLKLYDPLWMVKRLLAKEGISFLLKVLKVLLSLFNHHCFIRTSFFFVLFCLLDPLGNYIYMLEEIVRLC